MAARAVWPPPLPLHRHGALPGGGLRAGGPFGRDGADEIRVQLQRLLLQKS